MLVVLTVFGMGIAASLGIFSASSHESTIAQEIEEVSASALPSDEGTSELASSAKLASGSESGSMIDDGAVADSVDQGDAIVSDLKLQEVRDSYLRFSQAFPGVVVHYTNDGSCVSKPACVNAANPEEILINKSWAQTAEPTEIELALAGAHADLAIKTIWKSTQAAQSELAEVIPVCEIKKDQQLLVEDGKSVVTVPENEASVDAMRDVIVSVMTNPDVQLAVYPKEFHTDVQVEAAEQIASGLAPSVVVPVSSPSC